MSDIVRPGAGKIQRKAAHIRLSVENSWDIDPLDVVVGIVMGSMVATMLLVGLGAVIAGGPGALIGLSILTGLPLGTFLASIGQVVRDSISEIENVDERYRSLRRQLRELERCTELSKKERSASLEAAKTALREGYQLLHETLERHERAEKQYALLKRIADTLELNHAALVGYEYAPDASKPYYPGDRVRQIPVSALTEIQLGRLAELGMEAPTLESLIATYQGERDCISASFTRLAKIQTDVERVIHLQTTRNAKMRLTRTLGLDELQGVAAPGLLQSAGESLSYHLQGIEEAAQIEAGVYSPREIG